MEKKKYKISEVSKLLGVSRVTLYNWRKLGLISFEKSLSGGLNFISESTLNNLLNKIESKEEQVIIYCRVSSTSNKNNLLTQKERLINYCNAKEIGRAHV